MFASFSHHFRSRGLQSRRFQAAQRTAGRRRQQNAAEKHSALVAGQIEMLEQRTMLSAQLVTADLTDSVRYYDPDILQVVDGKLFFVSFPELPSVLGEELWVTDGTADGTHLVKDIYPGDEFSRPDEFVEFKGELYFTANDGTHGNELWKSDGTEAGTMMVKDINPEDGSYPEELVVIGDFLYFAADDSTRGRELWKSDGTAEGTVIAKDIWPGSDDSFPYELIDVAGTLFFTARDEDHGFELWKSDGTEAGTVMIADINPGDEDGDPFGLLAFGDQVFFGANDGVNGYEIWQSDGTEAGTSMIRDIRPGTNPMTSQPFSTFPYTVAVLNDLILFDVNDGVHGRELWRSDGTGPGTVLLKEIRPGAEGMVEENRVNEFVVAGDYMFFSADNGTTGEELWRTDGTAAGTVLVKDLDPGPEASYPQNMVAVNDRLYFLAYDDLGANLWTSDGTSAGTFRVTDSSFDSPEILADVDGTLYFTDLETSTFNTRLWILPTAPTRTIATGPVNNTSDLAPTFTWNAVENADHYDIWVNDLTTGQSGVIREKNVAGNSFTPSANLTSGHEYIWTVRAVSAAGESADWASHQTFTIASLNAPALTGPTDATMATQPEFQWSAVPGANHYDIWANNLTTGETSVIRDTNVTGTSFTPSAALTPGHEYIWTVRAMTGGGDTSPWAAHATFTLAALEAPSIPLPSGSMTSSTPLFQWSSVTDADHYDLWVNDLTTGQSGVIRNTNVAGTTFTPSLPLVSGHSYIWTVRAISAGGAAGSWAGHRTFTVSPSNEENPGVAALTATEASPLSDEEISHESQQAVETVVAEWNSVEWWQETIA